MRKLLAVAAIGALAATASMVVAQEDAEASRNYDLAGFEGVSVVGPHHVVISVGPAFAVRAVGPQQTLDDTTVEVEDGRLEIHPVQDDRWEGRDREFWEHYRPATFYVTLPRITHASVVASGDMRIDHVDGDDFKASVAGSGALQVDQLQVGNVRFSIAGSGDLTARGSASSSRVSIAGSGNLHASAVATNEATISIVGSGNAELSVANDARISIMGGGDVDITGNARCDVTRMGGGHVRCGGDQVAG